MIGGNRRSIEVLLRFRASPSFPAGKQKEQPLHIAVRSTGAEAEAIVSLLLRYGAEANARDSAENTPLHFAANVDQPKLVALLLQAGASPFAKNKSGKTPADVAKSTRIYELIRAANVLFFFTLNLNLNFFFFLYIFIFFYYFLEPKRS